MVLTSGIGYPASLTRYVSDRAAESRIVRQQLQNPKINVFTGKPFGENDSGSGFDMDSLITIDEEKLASAFGFDENALTEAMAGGADISSVFETAGNSADLSGMLDLSDIRIDLPDMGSIDLGDILDDLDISVSAEGLGSMMSELISGYQEYAQLHPEGDYSALADAFADFLQTDEGKNIISENIGEIIGSGEGAEITPEEISGLFRQLLEGYISYAEKNGYGDIYDDPEKFSQYLAEYLETEEAKDILAQWGDQMLDNIDISVTGEQIEKLAADLSRGYLDYAHENGAPDPGRTGEFFGDYLSTDSARKILTEGLAQSVDYEQAEKQISAALESYMRGASEEISSSLEKQISSAVQQAAGQLANGLEEAFRQSMNQAGASLQNAVNIDGDAFADAFQMNMSGEEFAELMMSMDSGQNATYENNLKTLGYIDFSEPSGIDIYPKDFESKEQVVKILDDYNRRMEETGRDEQVITYTDLVGSLMSSVTEIIDTISYVLIAFVAISLIVSSIMIGVITYISVLERKKEIGILRAIGASKQNISQVFNAETFIIGLCAGLIGIGLTLLILIPGNILIHHLAGTADISAVLPVFPAVILILLSILLTLVGGLIPSRKAAKSDPVTALRTE